MFYVGNEFDKKQNKEYKTEDGARKAAEKALTCLFDADGNVIADFRQTDTEVEQQQGEIAEGAPAENVTVTMTDDVPEDALNDDDVKIYDGEGHQTGTMQQDKFAELMAGAVDGNEIRMTGKIRRVFVGALRLRNRPSWDADAVAGTSVFTEKAIAAALMVDGKPMFKTLDGYYITGDTSLVEYIGE